MSMRLKSCVACGCERVITVVADIQSAGSSMKTRRLCLPCLLKRFSEITVNELPTVVQKELYATVEH
jgi:hypothetical protein